MSLRLTIAGVHEETALRRSGATLLGSLAASLVTTALVAIGLAHPVANRRNGALELASQLPGRAARSDQLDHLTPVLRRVSGMCFRHLNTSSTHSEGVHQNGSTPVKC